MDLSNAPPTTLSEQLNTLVDSKHSRAISASVFRAKKRVLLRIPPRGFTPLIKWLALGLALNLMLLLMVWSAPDARLPVLIGLAIVVTLALQISRVVQLSQDRPYDFSIDKLFSDLTEIRDRWRRAVRLDVTPPAVDASVSLEKEGIALRFLRDTGELTDREFKAAHFIAAGTFRPTRRFAYISLVLIALNVVVLCALPLGPKPQPDVCAKLNVECMLEQTEKG